MKRILILAIALCFAVSGMAGELTLLPKHKKGGDQWIVIGARAGINSTWLLNQNMMADKGIKYKASFGGGGGIMLGIHLSQVVALEVEGLYSLVNQKLANSTKDS